MSHLLAISIGPVQEFIAAARRTRDLWFGSYMLSEISKAVARHIRAKGGKLVFPHPEADLEEGSELNVANVIVAELVSADPKETAAQARRAAQTRWHRFAHEARMRVHNAVRDDIWEDQVDDMIEFYAAWIERTGDYEADRRGLMRLLAGRKNCRDFLPARGHAGVPKSSLDGRRESVLKPPEERGGKERTLLRTKEGEQLDVVGVVKRVAGGTRPYPSVARIAADPWIRGNKDDPTFLELLEACKGLGDVVHKLDRERFPQYGDFPFEGTAVYRSRHREWLEETDISENDLKQLHEALSRLPEPEPYLAVLVADGDRMGEMISRLGTAERNREFSRALADFATKADSVVKKHHGVLVYAGGDDILAFVPVDECLKCARELHDNFGSELSEYVSEEGPAPTLSVGIAIVHFMENLEDMLEYGRMAERAAKRPDRDGLAVRLYKRGGDSVSIRRRWKHNPDERLSELAQWFEQGEIPGGLPYELREMVSIYEAWPTEPSEQKETVSNAIRLDIERLLAKKEPLAGPVRQRLRHYLDLIDEPTPQKRLLSLSEEMLVARQIGRSSRQANSCRASTTEVST